MKTLITGGAGFIGSNLANALAERGDAVLVLDDLSTGRKENLSRAFSSGRLKLIEGSVLDEQLVLDCLRTSDACMHLASAVGIKLIVDRPVDTLLRNIRGNDTVISAAAAATGGCSSLRPPRSTARTRARRSTRTWTASSAPRSSRAGAIRPRRPSALANGYHTELWLGEHRRAALQHRRAATDRALQDGGAELRAPGAARRRRHRLRRWQAVALLCPCRRHRAGAAAARSDKAIGQVFNVGSSTEVSIHEPAERVIARAGSSSQIRHVPYDEAYEEALKSSVGASPTPPSCGI